MGKKKPKAGTAKKSKPKKLQKKRKIAPKKAVSSQKQGGDWVALELTQRGETERDINSLRELVLKSLGKPSAEIFIPIHYETEEFFDRNIVLLNGYFFIRHDPSLPYYKLKDSKFFEGVVADPQTQEVQIVPDTQIQKLKSQFDKIVEDASRVKVGDTVKILDGLYKNLVGKVTKVIKKDNMCIIKVTSLKSRNITVSASFLSVAVVEDDESSVVTFF
jgi:transcription antitermination factor NusG